MIRRTLVIVSLVIAAATVAAADGDATARRLLDAQALAWEKHFEDAARIYVDVLREEPQSRDAALGLARVRLWEGRYREARQLFVQLLARNRADADAAEGAATAAYWAGDFRTAQREFLEVIKAHPDRETARRSLDELRSASAAIETVDFGLIDDDQPFRSARAATRRSIFTDPLTRWDLSAGAYQVTSDAGGRHVVAFALVGSETVLPSIRLTAALSLGVMRTPDGRTHAIGGASARGPLARNDSLTVAFTRREILSNATSLYPFADVASIRWNHTAPWLSSAGAERDRFSDRNSAIALDVYALLPTAKHGPWTFWAGASSLFRDTRSSRFYVSGIASSRDPSGDFFRYTYRGAYDPYWTPHDLLEMRLILAVELRIGSASMMKIQGDGGHAYDKAVTFWPASGPTAFPNEIGRSMFDRTYQPWRVRVASNTVIAPGITLDVSIEHAVTSFYRANTIHAALARRR